MDDVKFLLKLNQSLQELEDDLLCAEQEKYPSVFILGLPRSGTTLLSQVVFNHLDLACTDHIVARFWETPVVGARLSKILLGGKKGTDFVSSYGRTDSLNEPHEFSWFWHYHLKYGSFESYDPSKAAKEIDWSVFKESLLSLANTFGKGVVYKPLELLANQLETFATLLDKSLYIYIERDPVDTAISIYKARMKHGIDTWFGSYPPKDDYLDLVNKDAIDQVAGQVVYLRRFYEKQLTYVPSERLLRITHQELCKDPDRILSMLVEKTKEIKVPVDKVSDPPSFEITDFSRDAELRARIEESMDVFNEKLVAPQHTMATR